MSKEIPLQKEYNYFVKIRPELLKEKRGKFALIKEEKLVGIFDTDSDAYKAGVLQFGTDSFLIVRIMDQDENTNIPILQLGLLNASS